MAADNHASLQPIDFQDQKVNIRITLGKKKAPGTEKKVLEIQIDMQTDRTPIIDQYEKDSSNIAFIEEGKIKEQLSYQNFLPIDLFFQYLLNSIHTLG